MVSRRALPVLAFLLPLGALALLARREGSSSLPSPSVSSSKVSRRTLPPPSPASPLPSPSPASAAPPEFHAEAGWHRAFARRAEGELKFSRFRKNLWEFQRSFPLGRMPEGAYRRAEEAHRKLAQGVWKKLLPAPEPGDPPVTVWKPRGPAPLNTDPSGLTGLSFASGRATAVAIDPANPSVLYLGTAQGGVWKSSNGGGAWAPLSDDQPSLAIGSIFLDPSSPGTIYVGTGEGHLSGISYAGRGLLRSADGGATWSRPAGERFSGVSIVKIAASQDGKRLYLGTTFDGAGEGYCSNTYFDKPDQGLFASGDGGVTWTSLFSGPVTDFEIDTSAATSVLYIAPYRQGILRLVDDGSEPVKLPFPDGQSTPAALRIELALAPSDPKVIYASPSLSDDGVNGSRGSLYLSQDGGDSWAELPGAPDHCRGQCDYDNAALVHPTDPGTVYFGGSLCAVWKLTGGLGAAPQFSAVSLPGKQCPDPEAVWPEGNVHPDLHGIAFAPDNPEIVYVASDGGLGVSKDGGATWSAPNNGLATLQFYGACTHPTKPGVLLGGTQDNGVVLTDGSPIWNGILTGDGLGCSMVDAGNAVVFSVLGGLVVRTKFKGLFVDGSSFSVVFDPSCAYPGADGCGETFAYFPVMASDPANPETLFLGSQRLWRSTQGGEAGSWKTLSGDLTSGNQGLACSSFSFDYLSQDILTGIAVRPGGKTLYTLSAGGAVAASGDGGDTWKIHTGNGLPKRYGSAIAADAEKSGTVYASFSGFSEATPEAPGHVFRSEDGGVSWAGVEPGGVDIPVNSLVAHPASGGVLFAGTDLGVLASYDGGKSWAPPGAGLPTVAVYWIGYHAASSQLVAATFGRSAWSVSFPAGFAASPEALVFSTPGDAGPKNLTLSNPGHPASLQLVSAKASAPWLKAPSEIPVGAQAPVQLPVAVDPSGLAPGEYSGNLLLKPSAGGEAITIPVTLKVAEGGGGGAAGDGGAGGNNAGQGGSAGPGGVGGATAGGASGQAGAGAGGLAGVSGQAGVLGSPSTPAGSDVRPAEESGGCGCRVGGPRSSVGGAGGVALLVLWGRRRRRGESGSRGGTRGVG